MANQKHLKVLKLGTKAWNAWREKHPGAHPNLVGANLTGEDLDQANFFQANLSMADLSKASLSYAVFIDANLTQANLKDANLMGANLSQADLSQADLMSAYLGSAELTLANLRAANLREAHLWWTRLGTTNVFGADFSRAKLGHTIFEDMDLRDVKGLERVIHKGPSTIGIDTVYRSQGHIPEAFLRGAGVPEEFITQIPALVASVSPIQFQSCFISYSHEDNEFAKRLHSAMQSENLRVWFAPEEMKGGKKLHEQIFQAIQLHDRLLLVLSNESMKSEWVMTEIRRAKKVEREENRRKLFPIRLVDFETIQKWECFDADSGKDLGVEVREYYIPDFSNWKDHDSFESEFAKLLRDLRATER